jgi:hypothetical protein
MLALMQQALALLANKQASIITAFCPNVACCCEASKQQLKFYCEKYNVQLSPV